ncbi:hypothetical protein [Streptomyces sp. NPDC018045]|uniref:hypothetical protein n=1 Tax=Streptomyces sp. NPDC018045 TaxID=3365037 RepID=UPI003799B367
MNLSALLAPGATLTSPAGAALALPPVTAAALYAAVGHDKAIMGLGGMPSDIGTLSLTTEWADDEGAIVTVFSVLRYRLDTRNDIDPVTRLCTTPTCLDESLGNTVLSRTCYNHLDALVPGLLPLAGDDIRPGDRETAAQDSRRMRLDDYEENVVTLLESEAQGSRNLLEHLRRASS